MNNKRAQKEIELEIYRMTCDSCAVHVSNALKSVKGVLNIDIPGWSSGKANVFALENISNQDLRWTS